MSDQARRPEELTPDKQALLALRKLRAKLEDVERSKTEPLAIVGLGCRFPGGADGPDAYRRLLHDGVHGVTPIPRDRWDVDAYYDPNPDADGRIYVREAGFLDGIDRFDAALFGISPREASSLDPQQRLLLEVAWSALEHAGIAPASVQGSRTGVFVGIGGSDYAQRQVQAGASTLDAYFGTGSSLSAAAGRLSYVFGLVGPSVAVDTACSASLVAVHLACQSLRLGECRMALAGGVNLMLLPEVFVTLCRARMLAPDGRCKTFDAAADGYVRGEGCGLVVLKRLSDARADGDRVLAIVRGSAVNQDGRSGGFTAPNETSQQQVIRDALASGGGLAPASIDYVEAHGTGTSLGDPIEVQALAAVLGEGRPKEHPLVIGSVKTNFGHLEWAAGIAGLIKVVLALQHEEIPPHLHVRTLNPYLDWDALPVDVATTAKAWPAGTSPRRAGISSFGFTGTNAHVVVEEAPAAAAAEARGVDRPLHVLALSARTSASLRGLGARAVDHLAARSDTPFGDHCFAANTGRSHLAERVAVVAATNDEAARAFAAWAGGAEAPQVYAGQAPAASPPEVAFLFTGQGSQYPGMGRQLYETESAFRRTLDRCCELFAPHVGVPLRSVMFGGGSEGAIDATAITQPALFALEYALAELWKSWGVEPAVVMGHSLGEYVAACVAGLFSLEDAVKLVAARARLMQSLPAGGAMASVTADVAMLPDLIGAQAAALSIAAVNAADSFVISGAAADVASAVDALAARGVEAQRLTVSHAFHSALMDPILDEFERIARTVAYERPRIGIISNVTGRAIDPAVIGRPEYWRRHLRDTVQCAAGLRTLYEQGIRIAVEIGPSPTLASLGRRTVADESVAWLASLRKGRDEWATLLGTLAAMYVRGVAVDWKAFDREYARRKVEWPTYVFDRRRYWFEQKSTRRTIVDADVQPRRDEWLYEAAWEKAPVEHAIEANGSWLVIGDGDGAAEALATLLPADSACVRLPAGSNADPAAIDAGIDRFLESAPQPRRVVYLARAASGEDGAIVDEAEGHATRALRIVQALARNAGAPARLWIATRGAQHVPDAPAAIDVAHAPLWGLGRTIAAEHEGLWGGLVDLDPAADATAAAAAIIAAACDEVEDQTAFRGGVRFVARLTPKEMSAEASSISWRPEAAYLVTGGFGGIGLEVARWIARQGGRRLILLGRHALPPRGDWADLDSRSDAAGRVRAVLELEALGAAVETAQVDAGDAEQLSTWIAQYRRERRPPIRGIVHAAGVTQYQAIADHRRGDLEAVWRGKVTGAAVLDRLFSEAALDFFVLFSSASALINSPLVGSYAAANAFLDAIAERRRARGLPALSVNWGAWSRVGMAAAGGDRGKPRSDVVPPEIGIGMLAALVERGGGRAAVLPMEWREWKAAYPAAAAAPFLRRVIERDGSAAAGGRARAASVRAELLAADEASRPILIAGVLTQAVAAVLRMPAEEIDPGVPLRNAGIDSLMALELRNILQDRTGVSLPLVMLVEGPSVSELVPRVAAALAEAAAVESAAPARTASAPGEPDPVLAGLADLSDEAVDAMLKKMLAER